MLLWCWSWFVLRSCGGSGVGEIVATSRGWETLSSGSQCLDDRDCHSPIHWSPLCSALKGWKLNIREVVWLKTSGFPSSAKHPEQREIEDERMQGWGERERGCSGRRERRWLGGEGKKKHSEKMTMLSTYEKRPQWKATGNYSWRCLLFDPGHHAAGNFRSPVSPKFHPPFHPSIHRAPDWVSAISRHYSPLQSMTAISCDPQHPAHLLMFTALFFLKARLHVSALWQLYCQIKTKRPTLSH